MLVLCSNGLSSEALLSYLSGKTAIGGKAALVVTADNEYKEKNYHVPRATAELESLGLQVDIFDLDRQEAELLLCYDAVEFIGGNPYYLLQSIREHKAREVLKEIAESRILIGWSAAAFVFGPTLRLVDSYSPEMNFMKLQDLRGLSLTELQVLPHYGRFITRFERFEEKCREYEEKHSVKVIRLNDGDGVFIEGDAYICRA